jgi:pantoate--beta-alanine ligase
MSSRNNYLTAGERKIAPLLHRTLGEAAACLRTGESDYRTIESTALTALEKAGFRPDYFQIRRADDLLEPKAGDTRLVILTAAWLGRARLIDNYPIALPNRDK